MKFEEVLPDIREGKSAKRKTLEHSIKLVKNKFGSVMVSPSDERYSVYNLSTEDILADDWEIIN